MKLRSYITHLEVGAQKKSKSETEKHLDKPTSPHPSLLRRAEMIRKKIGPQKRQCPEVRVQKNLVIPDMRSTENKITPNFFARHTKEEIGKSTESSSEQQYKPARTTHTIKESEPIFQMHRAHGRRQALTDYKDGKRRMIVSTTEDMPPEMRSNMQRRIVLRHAPPGEVQKISDLLEKDRSMRQRPAPEAPNELASEIDEPAEQYEKNKSFKSIRYDQFQFIKLQQAPLSKVI